MRPGTASTKSAGSGFPQVMLDMMGPSIYRRSAFRLTGLPIDATPRDIRRRSDELAAVSRLGGTLPTRRGALLPLQSPPDADSVQEAIEELRKPDRRLVQELFWFWPPDAAGSAAPAGAAKAADPGMDLLAQGESNAAAAAWEAVVDGGSGSPVEVAAATHNLAVLCHTLALDMAHGDTVDGDPEEMWGAALYYWQKVVEDDICWHRLAARVRQLDDPRLTPQVVEDIRGALPRAIVSINAKLAADAFRDGDVERALTILDHADETGFARSVTDGMYEQVAEPMLADIRRETRRIEEIVTADRGRALDAVEKLLTATEHPLSVVDLLFQPGHVVRDGVHDEVALAVLQAAATGYGEGIDARQAMPVMERAVEVAATEAVRERLRENLDTVERDLTATSCWFCDEEAGGEDDACEVSMYGEVNRRVTYAGVEVTWQRGTAKVPRCAACNEKTSTARGKGILYVTGAVVLGVLGLIVSIASPLHWWGVLATAVVVVALLQRRSAAQAVVSEELERVAEFPVIYEKIRQGWGFGERPPGTT